MKASDLLKMRRKRRSSGVDVILIHVDSFYNTLYSYYNMGLLYIATQLKEEGYGVKCLGINDLMFLSYDEISGIIRRTRPSIVGFYTLSDNICQVRNFATQIKKLSPRSNIVVGGPLATSLGEKILEYPDFDMVVIGEGEYPMKMLTDFIVRGEGSLDKIPGLIYMYRGEIVSNPPAPPIKDLDSLSYPDHGLLGNPRFFHVVSGRGCPYNCIFCFQGVHGLKYRFRGADRVADEIITNLKKYNSKTFDIIDDTFISNPVRVKDVAARLEEFRNESGHDFRFFCQGRVDIIEKHPDMLDALKRAGLCRVQVGIESGHPRTLELYRKKITVDQIKRIVKYAAELGGIVVVGNFILGGPFENEETFQASVELAKELVDIAPGAFEVGTAFMGPYPGTEIARNPEKYGLKVYDDQFKKGLTLSDCHMTSSAFGVNDIRQLTVRFEDELTRFMRKRVSRIPRELLKSHFDWARDFWIMTQWHQSFLQERQALADYFNFLGSPRFRILEEIPEGDIAQWYAQRTVETRRYSRDGRQILLPQTTKKVRLHKRDEILVYELSSGKLNIRDMLREFKKETGSDMTEDEILQKIFIPTFKKLEETYHIIFYR
ncbi:MAG: B12-binding domain-containing radical SAM protein [Candidatus Eremiobacteraeota bacterium]|nr:B12-binding domain-containing radical SAM protein [Candidatus Eremiobacteraeota bacterium]